MKTITFNNTELFYLEDFIQKEWFKFVDTIVDKDNRTDLEEEIYKILIELADKIRKARQEKGSE